MGMGLKSMSDVLWGMDRIHLIVKVLGGVHRLDEVAVSYQAKCSFRLKKHTASQGKGSRSVARMAEKVKTNRDVLRSIAIQVFTLQIRPFIPLYTSTTQSTTPCSHLKSGPICRF